MDRKESIKTMIWGSASLPFLKSRLGKQGTQESEGRAESGAPMRSNWAAWPDMDWVGPEFWGNRLQDWQLREGRVRCLAGGPDRSLHSLTHQLGKQQGHFLSSVMIDQARLTGSEEDVVGFRLGAKAQNTPVAVPFREYRRDAVFGEGLDAGIRGDGRLVIGPHVGVEPLNSSNAVVLLLEATPAGGSYQLQLTATEGSSGKELARLQAGDIAPDQLTGNLALLAHLASLADSASSHPVYFSDWQITGDKLISNSSQTFGPICFAQYTQDRGTLKMTAQLAPVEKIRSHTVALQIREEGRWKTVQKTSVQPLARTAHFRVKNWTHKQPVPYRIALTLPLRNEDKQFYYEGTIAAEPPAAAPLKLAVFSCNSHYGFPNNEVVRNVEKHRPDMAMFLGDQIYESHGGFGVERTHDVELATLDYLRKWYMFGWSYREMFRHIPAGFISDDHDVFHGNIWGQGGKKAPTDQGWGYEAQDKGGYKYPSEWVRMVQRTLTSHLPDPYDPTPVKQDIGVYYTDWTYGGVSFAIIEDRKFKTAPDNALPFKVINGFPQDPDIDLTQYYDVEAELLGDRQLSFLEAWAADWSHGARMKAVLSQSPLCAAHTMERGATHDRNVPQQPIPRRGEYPPGDYPARDMDTNGWPQQGRDAALGSIRKAHALHIVGDQHLGSVIHYGIEEHGDAGFVFTGPALNNIWPRRWWPTVDAGHRPLPGRPKYTGHFRDAFGNRLTMLAAANPVQTRREPGLIYDRSTGYGMVTFDKNERTMRIECWPRYVDPQANPEGQYDGWPVIIDQPTNYGRKAQGYLPEIEVKGMANPVLQLYNESTGELEYALRLKEGRYKPKIFDSNSTYRIRVGEPDENRWKEFDNIEVDSKGTLVADFS